MEWTWDLSLKCDSTEVSVSGRDVTFHKHFSNGTAAVRGTIPLEDDQHYWEIKMTTSVYGTDIVSVLCKCSMYIYVCKCTKIYLMVIPTQ